MGQAAAIVFRQKNRNDRIIIGKDTRLSGYMIEQALAAGICSMGADVYLVGPLPTPGIAFLTASMRADAGVVISGSHNAYEDNGIKFFDHRGYKLGDEVEMKMEALIQEKRLDEQRPSGRKVGKAHRIDDAIGRYIVFLKNTFPDDLTLDGLRIVLDCAHGAAYKVAPAVLEELGAEIFSLGVHPNGENINLNCGSLHPQSMQEKVRQVKADLGIALDGDADRIIFCDENGEIVDGDRIMCTAALEMKKNKQLNKNTVVATVMSNMGMEVALQKARIKLIRTAVGDRYVADEMRKNGYNLGGEQSGHVIFMDHNTTGDGIITALQILSVFMKQKKRFSEMTHTMDCFPQHQMSIPVREKPDLMEIKEVRGVIEKANDELKNEGRVLVRYSGTESVARVMVEGRDLGHVKNLVQEIAEVVRSQIGT